LQTFGQKNDGWHEVCFANPLSKATEKKKPLTYTGAKMTQNLLHQRHVQMKVNRRHDRQAYTQLGAPPERILREIAFVLKMTQRVRDQIEAEQEVRETVTV
jgi:hypothetical protein